MKYEVYIGNIGCVYNGKDKEAAREQFANGVANSKSGYGRASGECVILMGDGAPLEEYEPPQCNFRVVLDISLNLERSGSTSPDRWDWDSLLDLGPDKVVLRSVTLNGAEDCPKCKNARVLGEGEHGLCETCTSGRVNDLEGRGSL